MARTLTNFALRQKNLSKSRSHQAVAEAAGAVLKSHMRQLWPMMFEPFESREIVCNVLMRHGRFSPQSKATSRWLVDSLRDRWSVDDNPIHSSGREHN